MGARVAWKQRRVNTHREIHGRPSALYCQTASQLYERYARIASAPQPERGRQAQLAGFIMDYTGRALFRGHRISMKRKLEIIEQVGDRTLSDVDAALSVPVALSSAPSAASMPTRVADPHPMRVTVDLTGDDHMRSVETEHRASDAESAQPEALRVTSEVDAEVDTDDSTVKAIRKARFIIAQGGPHSISRAARGLSSAPMTPLNRATVDKLHSLHPTASSRWATYPIML